MLENQNVQPRLRKGGAEHEHCKKIVEEQLLRMIDEMKGDNEIIDQR